MYAQAVEDGLGGSKQEWGFDNVRCLARAGHADRTTYASNSMSVLSGGCTIRGRGYSLHVLRCRRLVVEAGCCSNTKWKAQLPSRQLTRGLTTRDRTSLR